MSPREHLSSHGSSSYTFILGYTEKHPRRSKRVGSRKIWTPYRSQVKPGSEQNRVVKRGDPKPVRGHPQLLHTTAAGVCACQRAF